jgi:hypothetical protein
MNARTVKKAGRIDKRSSAELASLTEKWQVNHRKIARNERSSASRPELPLIRVGRLSVRTRDCTSSASELVLSNEQLMGSFETTMNDRARIGR